MPRVDSPILRGRLSVARGGLRPGTANWGDQNLQKLYAGAGNQYDRLWPDRYLSPAVALP